MAVQIPFPLPSHGNAQNSKMRINLDFLVNKFNEFNTGAATWDTVAIGIANNETGTLTFYNSSNANYLTFQAGVTSTNTTFTLPTSAPTNTRSFLRSTNTGILSWSFFQEKASYTGNELLYVDGVGVVQEVDVGSGNKVLVNSVPPSFFDLLGTSNQITVTPNVGNFTLSLPQDIATSSNVQFGTVKTGAGSLSSAALKLNANNTGIYMSSATEMHFAIGGVVYAALDSSGNWFATTGETRADVIRGLSSLKIGGTVGSLITITSGASSPYSLTLPVDDGTSNQYLTTDGSGVLSWTNAAGTGTVNSGTANQLSYYASSTNAVSGTSALQLSGSALLIPATTNQIILGTTRTVTITAPTPASSSRTVTFPDLSGDYSVVGTISNQSISGVKNFTGSIQFADGTEAAPALALASDSKTGIGSLHSRSISFITQNGSGNGTEAFWINGSQQIIAAQNGTAAIPAYSFARDGGAGLACQLADNLDIIAGTTLVSRFTLTSTSDSSYRILQTLYAGGNSCYSKFAQQTTTSITTAKSIHTIDEYACLLLVTGNDGSNYFADLILDGFSASTPTVITSKTISGSPTARTYTKVGNSDLKLAMASGTYATNVVSLQVKAR